MSCSTAQQKIKKQAKTNSANCPSNGTCSATRTLNQGLKIYTDEWGKTYVKLEEKPNSYVLHYEYVRNKSPENYADDFYREEIYIELPATALNTTLTDQELQEVKLVFGRFCYCKGAAGQFVITNGTLKIKHSEKESTIDLTFKAPVPQILEKLHFTFSNSL